MARWLAPIGGLKWPPTLISSADKHGLNRTAGAGVCRKGGIADIEKEGWLPGWITGDFVKLGGARSRFTQGPLMVHHFHSPVTGARSKAAGSAESTRSRSSKRKSSRLGPGLLFVCHVAAIIVMSLRVDHSSGKGPIQNVKLWACS